ncbi:MAG: ATP-binding protein [Smithella sp.]
METIFSLPIKDQRVHKTTREVVWARSERERCHLAVALALKSCQAGRSIYFTTMEDLIGKLKHLKRY